MTTIQPAQSQIKIGRWHLPHTLLWALLYSQALAGVWWLVALWLRERGVNVWFDQERIFRPAVESMADPYVVWGFVNPPWMTLLLLPFQPFSLQIATLLQTCLYFALLTGVLFRFGGTLRTVLLVLTSYIAFDATLQLNLDWAICIGLLLPLPYSGPFLLLKPQLALGYYFGVSPRAWPVIGGVTAAVAGVSVVIWGWWPQVLLNTVGGTSIGRLQNIAPLHLLPWPIAIGIGLALGWLAFRRQQPALGILAWLFFTPYIALYSLLLHLGLLALLWFRLALIISIVLWIVYGGAILLLLSGVI